MAPPLQPQWTGHPWVSVYHGLSVAIPCKFWWARALDFFSAAKWVRYLYPEPVALHWLGRRQCSHGSVDALSSYVFCAAGFLFPSSSLHKGQAYGTRKRTSVESLILLQYLSTSLYSTACSSLMRTWSWWIVKSQRRGRDKPAPEKKANRPQGVRPQAKSPKDTSRHPKSISHIPSPKHRGLCSPTVTPPHERPFATWCASCMHWRENYQSPRLAQTQYNPAEVERQHKEKETTAQADVDNSITRGQCYSHTSQTGRYLRSPTFCSWGPDIFSSPFSFYHLYHRCSLRFPV